MKEVKYNELPQGVQFIGVHMFNGMAWAATYKVVKGVLYKFNDSFDDWEECDHERDGVNELGDNKFYMV